jgi:PAS domain S-box-containing protein
MGVRSHEGARAGRSTRETRLLPALAAAPLVLGVLWAWGLPRLLADDTFMAHGYCYRWIPALVALHVGSDTVIGLSYVAISLMLGYLVARARGRIPFRWMFVLFGVFIVACGVGHFMEAWVVWAPRYWLSGAVKLVTAVASVSTAIALVPLLPSALALVEQDAERDSLVAGVMRAAGAGTWIWDLGSTFLEWDPSLELLHGLQPGVFDGGYEDAFVGMHPDDRERVRGEMQRAVEHGHDFDSEYRVVGTDGEPRVVSAHGRVVRAEDGRPLRMVGMCWDVTARRRAEEQFRAAVEAAPSAMIMVRDDGRIALANAKTEELFGYPCDELVGEPIEKLVPKARHDAHRRLRADFLARPQAGVMGSGRSVWAVRRDGSEVPVEVILTPVRRGAGLHVLASVTDLSERRRQSDDVRRLNLELERKIAELKTTNEELEGFSYSVSHDLRAPLRAIHGYTRMLVEDHGPQLDGDARRLIDVVATNANQMGRLIDDLLALSRLGRCARAVGPVDLRGMAGSIVQQLRERDPDRAVSVEIGTLPEVEGDPGMLRQLFVNLVGNAWKFTTKTAGARITLDSTMRDGERVYFVRDNGAGFDPAYTDKLFGVFQRLHTSDEFEGNGIGLVIVRRIVQRHGGRVWAEGGVGAGATFFFTLGPQEEGRDVR